MRKPDRFRATAFAGVALGAAVAIVTPAVAADSIAVEADEVAYDQKRDIVEAIGDVRVEWRSNVLEAGRVYIDQVQRRLITEDGLTLETPDFRLQASSCDLDVDDETGVLNDVEVQLTDGTAHFGGKQIVKHLGGRYTLEDGFYTTCESREGKPPEWSLAGNDVDLELGDYGVIRGGTFRVVGYPVLYMPYIAFPTIDERHSGFLFPRVGLSDERGFVYSQPFFWNINKQHDVTFTVDVETSARVGMTADYRYRPRKDVFGEIQAAYFNEALGGASSDAVDSPLFEDEDPPENRGMVGARHRQNIAEDYKAYADLLLVSDDLYLREIDSVDAGFVDRSLRSAELYSTTQGGVLRELDFATFGVATATYKEFVAAQSRTVHKPGELWGAGDGGILGFGYQLDGAFTEFLRRDGSDGSRMNVSGLLTRALTPGTPVTSTAWGRGRFIGYRMDERTDRDKNGKVVEELDRYENYGVVEGGLDVRSSFFREYDLRRTGIARFLASRSNLEDDDESAGYSPEWLLHTLEPFSSLRATSAGDTGDLPLYDELDRIESRTTLTYGVSQRFLFGESETVEREERARVSVAQTYNFNEDVIDDHLSDVDFSAAIRPTRGVSVSGLTSYNVGSSELTGAVAELSLAGVLVPAVSTRRSSLDIVYRFVRGGESEIDADLDDLETLEGRVFLAVTDELSVGLNGRFDFPSDKFVESGGGFRIESSCRCWAIDLGLTNRVNPDETQLRLAIELRGLGGLGSSALDYQTPGLAGLDHGETVYGRYGW
jgi:lipopolysaccharide assembly outer membrane protein LptD (OstA)